jgi:hypothetical protein
MNPVSTTSKSMAEEWLVDAGAVLFWVLVIGSTGWTAVDAARFSRDEYATAFRRPDLKYYFVASPLLVFCCGAGLGAPFVYFLWGRRRLERVRDGEELEAPWPVRAADRVMVGNWDRGLAAVDRQLDAAADMGASDFTLRVSEGEVGIGLIDGWDTFANLVMDRITAASCSIVHISETGAPGTRTLVVRVAMDDGAAGPHPHDTLSDADWVASGRRRYEALVERHYGSPETIAVGGEHRERAGDVAAALFFYQKAIDLLHTLYDFSGMATRLPSEHDWPLIRSYLHALGQVRRLRPAAPVAASVTEVTHRLRTISTACREADMDPGPYLRGLDELSLLAPDVDVSGVYWKNPSVREVLGDDFPTSGG